MAQRTDVHAPDFVRGFKAAPWPLKHYLLPDKIADELSRQVETGGIKDSGELFMVEQEMPPPLDAEEDIDKASEDADESMEEEENHDSLLPVWDFEALQKVQKRLEEETEERAARINPVVESAMRRKGKRGVPHGRTFLRKLDAGLIQLQMEMPNFVEAVDVLRCELALAVLGPPDQFQVSPILLWGAPGIGKTRFAQRLATLINQKFCMISAATAQGAFELTGTSKHWSTSAPGRLSKLLADGEASPILLIDEVDKSSADEKYSLTYALLELLEPLTSRQFRDQALEVEFDASRIIVLATANNSEAIMPAIQSRFCMIEVEKPSLDQRLKIISRIAAEYSELCGIEYESGLAEVLAESDIDLRTMRQALRQALGRAACENRVMKIGDMNIAKKEKMRCGFL